MLSIIVVSVIYSDWAAIADELNPLTRARASALVKKPTTLMCFQGMV